jgi:hypothetical protein
VKLPGLLGERLRVLHAERARLHGASETAVLEDADVRVECDLAGSTMCVRLRLVPEDIQFLRNGHCADFALLLARGGDAFEAHVVELTRTAAREKWDTVRQQHEWAIVRLLAIAGVLGIEIEGVVAYTAYNRDKLTRDPALLKVPVDPENTRRWAEARRTWESGRLRMDVLGRDVEHRRLPAREDGPAVVACRRRASPGDTVWVLETSESSSPASG